MYDINQFIETYITECFELLDEMEELLLQLDNKSPDIEQLNAIFRCAHSIKGGGGAFGFEGIVSFAHVLEALLEELRSSRLSASQDIVDALLESVDVLRSMVTAAQQGDSSPDDAIANNLRDRLLELSAGSVSIDAEGVKAEQSAADTNSSNICKHRYKISFVPKPTLLQTGNEPLLLIRELATLGAIETNIDCSKLQPLEEIDPEQLYLSWVFYLKTDATISAIAEIFEFVDDECDLQIVEIANIDANSSADSAGVYDDAFQEIISARAENNASVTVLRKQNSGAEVAVENITKNTISAKSVQSIRVDIDKIDRLVNMVGEIVIAQAMIMMHVHKLSPDEHSMLIKGAESLAQYTRELQEAVMSVRMQPVKSIFARMNRLVRDLSRELNKNIKLETYGESTEIDKAVIEQLADPLTHMIRNSIDHGIEHPQERLASGKPEFGTIKLSADQRGGRIIIEIADDGRGINREKVLEKAIERGIVSADVNLLGNEEIDQLIFHAGFSTADTVTNVSGRGVGMDVVRKNIEALGGFISLKNKPGKGAIFTVSLPLTLAILDGMIIRVGQEFYVLPITSIIQSLRPESGAITTLSGSADVINIRGEFIPLIHLHELFSIKGANCSPESGLIILVENAKQNFGLVVDEMVNQQQVVVKSLEDNANPIAGISGATILGDGKVSLILDVAGLYEIGLGGKYDEPLRLAG